MLMFCIFGLLHECLGVVDGKKMRGIAYRPDT